MILPRLGRWNHQAGKRLRWRRIWLRGHKWTPFCKVGWRHTSWRIIEEERKACADLCLYGDIAEVAIPDEWMETSMADLSDMEVWTRAHCAAAILARDES